MHAHRSIVRGLLLLGVLLVPGTAWTSTAADPSAARSTEILRLDCANEVGRREITLFLNGTVRVLEGPPGKEAMRLGELNPDQLDGALHRLADQNLADARHLPRGIEGQWIEKCMLALELPDRPVEVFHFGRYDTLPLALSEIVRVARDVAAKVPDIQQDEQLPAGYEPRLGDVLKRIDGNLYKVHGITDDQKGVDLQGLVQPVTIYMRVANLRREFVALVSRPAP
jgi:hypothetical protein